MKKLIIGTVVAALILHIWQFVSWGPSGIHGAEVQYTENQDKIIAALSENLKEGQYFVPTAPPGTSFEEAQKLGEQMTGKPWATINYHPEYNLNMGMNMLRGFVINLIAAFLLCWILLKFANLNFKDALLTSLAVGFIGYLTITYLNHIWFEGSTMGYLIDAIVAWGLVGAWLGWYLPEKAK